MSFHTFEFSRYSPQQLVQVRDALRALTGSPGWTVFMAFIKNREQEIGMRALDDETKPKDYWKGFRDGCKIETGVNELLQYAEETVEERGGSDNFDESFYRGAVATESGDSEGSL